MEHLKSFLEELIKKLEPQDKTTLLIDLKELQSVYPFNEYEFIISNLLWRDAITLYEYLEIRNDYLERNEYLHIFEHYSSPTGFWITWAQSYLHSIVPELIKPSKKIDPTFDNEYDFLYDHNGNKIRIELKASRWVDADSSEPLYVKALSTDTRKSFDMNFQQLKPRCCDVFVWIAVWRDSIQYWVLSSQDVESIYSSQHRGNTGEWQYHINPTTIRECKKFESSAENIRKAIIKAYEIPDVAIRNSHP